MSDEGEFKKRLRETISLESFSAYTFKLWLDDARKEFPKFELVVLGNVPNEQIGLIKPIEDFQEKAVEWFLKWFDR